MLYIVPINLLYFRSSSSTSICWGIGFRPYQKFEALLKICQKQLSTHLALEVLYFGILLPEWEVSQVNKAVWFRSSMDHVCLGLMLPCLSRCCETYIHVYIHAHHVHITWNSFLAQFCLWWVPCTSTVNSPNNGHLGVRPTVLYSSGVLYWGIIVVTTFNVSCSSSLQI